MRIRLVTTTAAAAGVLTALAAAPAQAAEYNSALKIRGFMWNNDKDTIYVYKPSGSPADVHSYTKSGSDPDRNGYITYHG